MRHLFLVILTLMTGVTAFAQQQKSLKLGVLKSFNDSQAYIYLRQELPKDPSKAFDENMRRTFVIFNTTWVPDPIEELSKMAIRIRFQVMVKSKDLTYNGPINATLKANNNITLLQAGAATNCLGSPITFGPGYVSKVGFLYSEMEFIFSDDQGHSETVKVNVKELLALQPQTKLEMYNSIGGCDRMESR